MRKCSTSIRRQTEWLNRLETGLFAHGFVTAQKVPFFVECCGGMW